MRIFVTGATGFVGSALVPELIAAGHGVIGLARSEKAAQALLSWGAQVHHGDLADEDSLRSAVAKADAVIHTAFNHDFANFRASAEPMNEPFVQLGNPCRDRSSLSSLPPACRSYPVERQRKTISSRRGEPPPADPNKRAWTWPSVA